MKNDASVSKPTTYLKLSKFHEQLMVTMNEDLKMVLYRHIYSLSSNQDQWQSLHITDQIKMEKKSSNAINVHLR